MAVISRKVARVPLFTPQWVLASLGQRLKSITELRCLLLVSYLASHSFA